MSHDVEPIRLAILNVEPLYREVVGSALSCEPGIDPRPLPLARSAIEQPIDIALVYVGQGVAAINALRDIRSGYPGVKLIAFGVRDRQVVPVIEAGAVGYVLESAGLDDLLTTVRAVARGETVCSGRVARQLFDRLSELSGGTRRWRLSPGAELSKRDREVLELIGSGLSNKEIAAHLRIALYTVKSHVRSLLAKLRVHRRRDAVLAGYELGLISAVPSRRLES